MTRLTQTRRRFITAGTGTVLAGLVGNSTTLAASGEWSSADSPIEETLHDVVRSSQGPYAVGEGGVVLTRREDGWETVLERGPTTESNPLFGAGVTDDGDHVWFAGGSGVVGRYDANEEELTDHSAPDDMTSTWEAVAVAGEAGSETVHLVNGSGEYLNGQLTEEGGVDWGEVVEPGGGSSALGVDFVDDQTGYVADTNSQVYETTDGGESWETIGIDGASESFRDVSAVASDDISVAAEDGIIYRYDGAEWTPITVGEATVETVDREAEEGLAAGAGGAVYEYDDGDWSAVETPTESTLSGIALGTEEFPDAAAGEGGVIVEHGEYTREDGPEPVTGEWTEIETPVDTALTGATQTSRGPYAAGEDGVVLTRRAEGWETAVERFPATEPESLTDVAASDDGDHVWFVGASGVVGRYDVSDYQLTDHSAPEIEEGDGSTSRKTSTWEGVAITGEAGSETIHLINGSGEYLNGQLTEAGGVDWGEVIEPGGGSSAFGVDFLDEETGYVCDTTSQVYETTDGGESWETIGIDGGSAAYNDVVARSPDEIYVAAGDGTVLRYNGAVWTKHWAGGAELLGADATEEEAALSGAEGTIYERTGRGWRAADTDAETTLEDVGLDGSGDYPHAAVGAGGLAVEDGEYEAEPIDDDEEPAEWEAAESPVEAVLYDVVNAENGYAVGEEGYVLERADGEWSVAVEDGPTGEGNVLNAVDATDLGTGIWFAGGSGVVGEYDAVSGELTDHSAPEGMTSTWEAIAVTGELGTETVHLVNGSGEYVNGTKGEDGSVEWGEVVEPGGGSSALGIDFVDDQTGYVVDTTSQVYETTDGGESWETIGVDGGSAAYTGVTARSPDEIYVSAGNGTVLRYNGAVWTTHWAGGTELNDVDANDDDIAAAGAEGTIVERTTRRWALAETPTEATIHGIALNGTQLNPGLVVGNPGTIFERIEDEEGDEEEDEDPDEDEDEEPDEDPDDPEETDDEEEPDDDPDEEDEDDPEDPDDEEEEDDDEDDSGEEPDEDDEEPDEDDVDEGDPEEEDEEEPGDDSEDEEPDETDPDADPEEDDEPGEDEPDEDNDPDEDDEVPDEGPDEDPDDPEDPDDEGEPDEDSDEDVDAGETASLTATGVDAEDRGRYEITNDGDTAVTATIVVDGEVVREVDVDAGSSASVTIEGTEGSDVLLCIDGEEVDRVRPIDC